MKQVFLGLVIVLPWTDERFNQCVTLPLCSAIFPMVGDMIQFMRQGWMSCWWWYCCHPAWPTCDRQIHGVCVSEGTFKVWVSRYNQLSDWSVYMNSDHIIYPQLSPYVPFFDSRNYCCSTQYFSISYWPYCTCIVTFGFGLKYLECRPRYQWSLDGGWMFVTSAWNADSSTGAHMDIGGPSDDCDSALLLWLMPWRP